jgi:hypothetical protein
MRPGGLYPRVPRVCLFVCPALLAAACADFAAPPGLDEIELVCPEFDCGGNSNIIDGTQFSHLSLDGDYNPEDLRLVQVRKGAGIYRLDVRGDEPRALDKFGVPVLSGMGLVGAALEIERKDQDAHMYIHITGARQELRFWVGDEDPIWTFRLQWSFSEDPTDAMRGPVCPQIADSLTWGNAAVEAIFFRGDLYDRHAKTVTAIGRSTGRWFNIACAGSVPAKMHAIRLTTAGSDEDHSSTIEQRRAGVKMYSADYCGTGKSFTLLGEELAWQNLFDWNGPTHPLDNLPAMPTEYEAIWSETGAVCMDVARLGDTPADADLWEDLVLEECDDAEHDLPPCTGLGDFPDDWKSRGYLLSADPWP